MGWSIDGDVYVEKNEDGFAGLIRHLQHPFTDADAGKSEYLLTIAYLRKIKKLLGITDDQIESTDAGEQNQR